MIATGTEREKSALASLEVAAAWRAKGNPRAELSCLSAAVTSFLSVAASQFSSADDGITYLHDQGTATVLRRAAELNNQLYQALVQGGSTPSAAVDNNITPVHIAWLVQEWDVASQLLTICLDAIVAKFFPLTKFWEEYYRAIAHLASDEPYDPSLPKARGYEKCWTPYLPLIADLTHKRDTSASRAEIGRIFRDRNRDKRLTDWEMIDGDGKHPVQWDFRESSILAFVEHSRQKDS